MPALSITGWVLVVRSSVVLRAVADQRADVLAQRGRGLGQRVAHRRVVAPGVEHADRLRALAGKDECKGCHARRVPLVCQKSSSTAPQVKPPPTPSSITRVAAADAAVAHRHVERQRHRRGRGVAVFVDGDDQLVQRQLQLARRALHDADVGLVRDQPVDVGFGAAAGLGEHGARGALEHADRQLEDRLAVHLQQRVAQHLAAGHRARHAQDADVAAVGVQVGGQDARRVAGLAAPRRRRRRRTARRCVRSLKSRMREKTSAPITSARARVPVRIIASATVSA